MSSVMSFFITSNQVFCQCHIQHFPSYKIYWMFFSAAQQGFFQTNISQPKPFIHPISSHQKEKCLVNTQIIFIYRKASSWHFFNDFKFLFKVNVNMGHCEKQISVCKSPIFRNAYENMKQNSRVQLNSNQHHFEFLTESSGSHGEKRYVGFINFKTH